MRRKFKVVEYVIGICLVTYFLDAFIFYIMSEHEYTFLESLFLKLPVSEISSRLILLAGIIVFGLFVSGKINLMTLENKFLQKQNEKISKGHFDSNFISSLIYQIRIHLNNIIGFSDLSKKTNLPPESRELYATHINTSSKFLQLLINNISDISKIESNELAIEKMNCDINKTINDIISIFQLQNSQSDKHKVSLVFENVEKTEEFTVLTDPDRLYFVLNNLVENSLSHTDEGIIKVGYKILSTGFLEFYVSDTGRGLSQDRVEKLFERFNKLTDNNNLPFDETALRLTISKSLVKILGGEIRADSKVGVGTTIFFTIPYLEVAQPTVTIREKKAVSPTTRNWEGKQILIAEDVIVNFKYLEELLRPTKIKIHWAKDGLEAVEIVKKNAKIELILMDILMPVMDGIMAAKEIKSFRKELPIIAQTAYFLDNLKDKDEEKFFDAFLIKPIWEPQLLAAIDKYIS